MAEGWTWDATLFAGTAVHYGRGRLPYAPARVPRLAEVLALDGTGRPPSSRPRNPPAASVPTPGG